MEQWFAHKFCLSDNFWSQNTFYVFLLFSRIFFLTLRWFVKQCITVRMIWEIRGATGYAYGARITQLHCKYCK